jgi:hypothetical protein
MDSADERHRQLVERHKHPRHRGRIAQVLIFGIRDRLRHPRDVGARAKSLSRTAQHHDAQLPTRRPHPRIRGPRCELGDDVLVEGVAHLRPIERQIFNGPVHRRRQE